ncbi:MAG TPA: endonuclease III [Acidimicrobiia bacterium]|nr:endonuclease III [Acidimicrobiia bacterium]
MPPKPPKKRRAAGRRVSPRLRAQAETVLARLSEEYPDAVCALTHEGPYQLLVATILSAQCTDERVNMVTPSVFRRYPTPGDLAQADPDELEALVRTTGFFRSKARNLIAMAKDVDDRFEGEVPVALEDLTTLGGVGRKTANVVRSVAFGEPGLPVDTHVGRLSRRLGLTKHTDPVKVEFDLMPLFAPEAWGDLSLRLIQHGRRVCDARKPKCGECVLNDVCPSAQ